jgi:hypothetical protein
MSDATIMILPLAPKHPPACPSQIFGCRRVEISTLDRERKIIIEALHDCFVEMVSGERINDTHDNEALFFGVGFSGMILCTKKLLAINF